MKKYIPLVFAGIFAFSAPAFAESENPDTSLFAVADMDNLNDFKWKKRPILVFANSADDPSFVAQLAFLRARTEELVERDVIVLTDTDPDARAPLRLMMRPRGFMLVLVDKEGNVELRKPFPWDVREITRSIDKMPARKREIREGKTPAVQK